MNQVISSRAFEISDRPSVCGTLKAFSNHKDAFKAGQYFKALLGHVSARKWCDDNGIVLKAASEGINTAGGNLVPFEVANGIIRLRENYGVYRRNARIIPMLSDIAYVPRTTSPPTGYWVQEAVAITTSQPTLGNLGLSAKKLAALAIASSELEEDAIAFGDFMAAELAYALAKAEDDAAFAGDATSTYGGITGLRKIFADGLAGGATPLAGAVDAASGHDTMAELDATDLASLIGKLPAFAAPRAKWFLSPTMFGNVFCRLAGTTGGITSQIIDGRVVFFFMGFPCELTPSMLSPATSTTDASDVAMILFGDLSLASTLGDTREITIARAENYKFAEDQIAFRGTERIDIVNHGTGDSSNAGAVVALMGE